MEQPVTPSAINKLRGEIALPFAMLAGMQLDLFSPLENGSMSLEQLAEALNVRPVKLRPLAYALVAAGLLEVEGEQFSNTPESSRFLVKGTPTYLGGMHELLASNWEATLKTAESIRTGVPQARLDFTDKPEHELEAFLRGLHGQTMANGRDLVEKADLGSWCRTLVDVGGGSGGLAIAVAQGCPDIKVTVMELPTVTPITQRFIDSSELNGRVTVVSGDALRDQLEGSYDAAVLRAFIQVFSPEDAVRALRRIRGIVVPGGSIYIMGLVVDNTRLSPISSVGFSLMTLNMYDDGQAYTEQEYLDWLAEAGFAGGDISALSGGYTLISAKNSS